MKYEQQTLKDITQLRSLSSTDIKPKDLSKINNQSLIISFILAECK